jgi:hypothetical protein
LSARFLAKVFSVPLALLILGCVPGVSSILYSGHCGRAWLLLPLCFPYIVLMLAIKIWKLAAAERTRDTAMAVGGVLLYVLVAYPTGRMSERYINATIGLPLLPGTVFKQATFPLGKALPPYYTREEEENPDLPSCAMDSCEAA